MSSENSPRKMALNTTMLNELESGPWPDFVTDLNDHAEKKPVVARREEFRQTRWNHSFTKYNIAGSPTLSTLNRSSMVRL